MCLPLCGFHETNELKRQLVISYYARTHLISHQSGL
jgi:hypothetical protein